MTAPPSLTGAVDTEPLASNLLETPVCTHAIRAFWRDDRFVCTDLRGGDDAPDIVEVALDGRVTVLATLTGQCRFVDRAGPHVVAGVQWGRRSDETEVWLVPPDRSPPRLLMRGDPAVATPDIMLPPVTNPDGTEIGLRVLDGNRRASVRVVDDRGALIAERGEDDAVEIRAPYLLDETPNGTYQITNASTGQVHELVPTRPKERDLLARYRWKHGQRWHDRRLLVIKLGDTFLVDCETGRSWTLVRGEPRVFLSADESAIAVVSHQRTLQLGRLDDRWRSG